MYETRTRGQTHRIALADPAAVGRAAHLLRAGELVAFPTETVYGLGADASNADAVGQIFATKGRPAAHPVIVHVRDAAQVPHWARELPAGATKLAKAFWPGPLTLILPRTSLASDAVTGGQDNVGLRVPAHPVAQMLLAAFAALGGKGIAAPSANRFGHVSPTTAQHVADDLGDDVSLILDGGACAIGMESTIVAFAESEAMLLRPGAIDRDSLARVLGRSLVSASAAAPRASGSLVSHYAPRTPLYVLTPLELPPAIRRRTADGDRVAVLALTVARPAGFDGPWVGAARDSAGYARSLYAHLRTLDTSAAAAIFVEQVPDATEWDAVRDRLGRAASGAAKSGTGSV